MVISLMWVASRNLSNNNWENEWLTLFKTSGIARTCYETYVTERKYETQAAHIEM